MIVPMKKVWLAILDSQKDKTLYDLGKFGLVHVEKTDFRSVDIHELERKKDQLVKALNIIESSKKENKVILGKDEAIVLAQKVISDQEKIGLLREESKHLSDEIDRTKKWGDFRTEDIYLLREKGITIKLFELDVRKLDSSPQNLEIIILERKRNQVLAAVAERGINATRAPEEWEEFFPPGKSISELHLNMESIKKEINTIEKETRDASRNAPSMRNAIDALEQEISFNIVHDTFVNEGVICHLTGYIPAENSRTLKTMAQNNGWGLMMDDPSGFDMPPTKVKNNPFVRMIAPVFDFLGTTPGYNEYEISAWFLIFFSLFFAMIFSDAGYGLIMFFCSITAMIFVKVKKKPVPDGIRLLLLLSATTIVWGAVTASWFSIPAQSLPVFLQNISIRPISKLDPDVDKNIKVLCFVLGTLHMTIARIKNIIKYFPNPKFLGQLGSLSIIYGMLFFVLNLVVSSKEFPIPPFALWLVVGGFSANIIFGSYEKNIFNSILEGFKAIIPNFLGTVGIFADIVSYIRLWAVGLAGASLGTIINSMGIGLLKPVFMIFFGVLLFTFGHTLNIVLNLLSVIVHGVRLNMLEFSNHLGMEWSGTKYDPFKVTFKN